MTKISNGLIKNSINVKKRVLVVDDQPPVLRFLRLLLNLNGYEAIAVTDGLKAVELLRSQDFDLLLLDIVMPGMGGFEVLQVLRGFSSIPVIALSADSVLACQALSLGADDYITKPFQPVELMEKIRGVIGLRGSYSDN